MINFVTVFLAALSVLTTCCGHSVTAREAPGLLVEEYLRTDHYGQCQSMQSSLAKECGIRFGYNTTRMPNLLNFDKQRDALEQFRGFDPLLKLNCSSELRLLLCLFYFPSCSSTGVGQVHMVTPCRPICERVRKACSPVLRRFNFGWPETFDCERLMTDPLYTGPRGEKVVCINQVGHSSLKPTPEQEKATITQWTTQPTASTIQCLRMACRMTKVKKKTFKGHRFQWIVAATLRAINLSRTNSKVFILDIKSTFLAPVLNETSRSPARLSTLEVHTDTGDVCSCPRLQRRRLYLLAGHVNGGRFVLRELDGLVSPFKKRFWKKLPSWLQQKKASWRESK